MSKARNIADLLNEETCLWDAPVSIPDRNNLYQWDEETTSWKLME